MVGYMILQYLGTSQQLKIHTIIHLRPYATDQTVQLTIIRHARQLPAAASWHRRNGTLTVVVRTTFRWYMTRFLGFRENKTGKYSRIS